MSQSPSLTTVIQSMAAESQNEDNVQLDFCFRFEGCAPPKTLDFAETQMDDTLPADEWTDAQLWEDPHGMIPATQPGPLDVDHFFAAGGLGMTSHSWCRKWPFVRRFIFEPVRTFDN